MHVTVFYLFASNVLEVLACHDASEFGFNKALGPLPLWRPAKDDAHKHLTIHSVTVIQVFQQWKVQQWLVPLRKEYMSSRFMCTDLSTNMGGESGRVVSKSFIAFHSLMQLWSEAMQLS